LDSQSTLTQPVTLRVNGKEHAIEVEPRVSLLDVLRDYIQLTGTKKGCDQGACGACTVLVNGERINSCLTLAVQYEGHDIVTVEGLANGESLHPLQQAFIKHDGFQCGYCTPGQLCSAVGMLKEISHGVPSAVSFLGERAAGLADDELRERMSGNLCRCGAYIGIRDAIREVYEGTSK
jgi:xanthine dehydrogenase YagT iron-sulfur-binding subunit